MITRIAIVFTAPASPGWAITSAPMMSWITNATVSPIRNSASRTIPHRTWRRRTNNSSDAATNASPPVATTTAAIPILCPGISANSDTASALLNAVSAAVARMR